MTDHLLVVEKLSKEFVSGRLFNRRTVRAVNEVSFSVRAGETLGLVGESGSGKSTVARLVLRLLEPTLGSVVFDGLDLTTASSGELRSVRRDLQIIFQDPYGSLNPRSRIGTIMDEPVRLHLKLIQAERKALILKTLDEVGLSERYMRLFPHQLSGGQRQRVAIARALVLQPKLIVADEAVSALDVSVQAQVLNLMRDLQQRRGIAFLFISHDLSVVRYLSHRIAVMYQGLLVEVGPSDEVYYRPRHPYTKMLIDSIPGIERNQEDLVGAAKGDQVVLKRSEDKSSRTAFGCSFQDRCVFARDRCKTEAPLLRTISGSVDVACHYAEDLRLQLVSGDGK